MSTLTEATASSPAPAHEPSRHCNAPQCDAGTSAEPRRADGAAVRKAAARKGVSVISTMIAAVAVAAFLFLAVGPRVLGYQTSTMLTGSMAPLINPGDVVVTAPTPVRDIREGDVITYRIPVEDRRVETHRVTELLANADGSTAVRTKGDANNGADPWTATLQGATVDKHIFTVPYMGHAIRFLRQPAILNTLVYGAPGVLVIGLLASIWRRDPEPPAAGT